MARMPDVKIEVTQVRIIFFPLATFTRAGDIVRLSVLGVTVYRRAGDARQVLGFNLKQRAEA